MVRSPTIPVNDLAVDDARATADFLELLLVLGAREEAYPAGHPGRRHSRNIIVFLLPKMYTATATILPPQQNQSILSSLVGQVAAAPLSISATSD